MAMPMPMAMVMDMVMTHGAQGQAMAMGCRWAGGYRGKMGAGERRWDGKGGGPT